MFTKTAPAFMSVRPREIPSKNEHNSILSEEDQGTTGSTMRGCVRSQAPATVGPIFELYPFYLC